MDFFPQPSGFAASLPKEEVPKIATDSSRVDKSAKAELERAQMTIFYARKAIVFNEFQTEKAKEVMRLASQGSSQSNPNSQNAFAASKLARIDSNSTIGTSSTIVPPSLDNKTILEHI
ncbi:protein TIFY 10A-like [Juglans regia]|uniref:Protein TIFY n=1 Tax=Juglans regia TaxID=51240 RepID=A0A6P9EFX0_JUGRE|nr:protein TIFY 10A-like [Juglans regia]